MTIRSGPAPLSASIPRFEDEPLISGRGRFSADLIPAGALHAWFVRSPFAAGNIAGIDASLAAAAPGVAAVYDAGDLQLNDLPCPPIAGRTISGMDRPMLARDRVTHVGQAIAVVIASRPAAAEDAAGLVFPDIEPGAPVLTVADALAGGTLVHPDAGTNVTIREQLAEGPEPAFGELIDVTVDVEHPRLAPSPIEPLAIVAVPEGERLHLQVGTQAPHQLQQEIAGVLGIDAALIRVSVPEVGGAFGMKRFYPEYAVVAAAARRLGRPVAWVQPRRDLFASGTQGRGQHHTVTLRATPDGHIREARFSLATDVGAYPHRGTQIGLFSRLVATGLYDIARVVFDLVATVTNLPPTAPYRGAGRPEAALAIERAIDALARELQIDPAEVRRRNLISRLPHRTPTGAKHDSGDYAAALDRALQLANYEEVRREQARRQASGGRPLGIGIGAFVERAGGAADSWEYGAVAIGANGELVARTGATSAGQGHATVWRRIVAEVFDVEPPSIVLHAGDTDLVADSTGSFASRSAQVGAAALWRCAERVRVAAVDLVAELLEAAPADIVVTEGAFHVVGVPGLQVTLAAVAAAARDRDVELAAEERYSPGAQTFPYGVHIAVVEIDLATGRVEPQHLVAVDDVGTVLDAMIVAGQVAGSVMQGLGAALYEQMRFDDWGQPQATTFMDYLIPSFALNVPLTMAHTCHPAPSNPLGVKGAGEGGCIGMPPAILNATLDALAPWGVTDLQIPLTPNAVWQALRAAGASRAE